MWLEAGRTLVCRRPGLVVAIWLLATTVVGFLAPSLTRLAAEGQAKTLAADAESQRAARDGSAVLAGSVLRIHGRRRLAPAGRLDGRGPAVRRAVGEAIRGSRPAQGGRTRSGTSLRAGDRASIGKRGWHRLAGGRPPVHSLRRTGIARDGPVASDSSGRPSTGRPGRARDPLDWRRRDRPRLHGQRPDVARPRRHGDRRSAHDRAVVWYIGRSGWRSSPWRRSASV